MNAGENCCARDACARTIRPELEQTRADVRIRYQPHALQLEVRDDGVGTATSDGLGHGLIGIRERVKIYGGEMTAESTNGGGFVLSTRLPFSSDRS